MGGRLFNGRLVREDHKLLLDAWNVLIVHAPPLTLFIVADKISFGRATETI